MNTEWEADYWTGVNPAGYSQLPFRNSCFDMSHPNPQGNAWADRAQTLLDSQQLQGARVLEVGCANGLMVMNIDNGR